MGRPIQDRQIEDLFAPHRVRSFTCQASDELVAELRADERAALAPMIATRQAEFATARACARSALAALGVDASIPRLEGGAPQWPVGITGSISHTRGFCAAVASPGRHAIGLDVEEFARMKPAVERRILIDAEQRELADLSDEQRRLRVCTIFAAKEAFYKAHYEIDPRYLGFDVVKVTVSSDRVIFAPASHEVDRRLLARTSGRFLVDQGRVVVGVSISTTDGTSPLPSPA